MKPTTKRHWIVRVERLVLTDVYCSDCTEEQARTNPFEYATEEQEVDQRDWTVKSVEPNE